MTSASSATPVGERSIPAALVDDAPSAGRLRAKALVLGILAIMLAIGVVWLAVLARHRWWLALSTAVVPWIMWTQARRHDGLARARRSVPGPYVLFLRSSDIDAHPDYLGFEDALVRALEPVGPVVMIDKPGWFTRSSAIRLPLVAPHESWVARVGELADAATLVVFALAPRRGYRNKLDSVDDGVYGRAALDGVWLELELMPTERFRGDCLIFVGHHWDRRALTVINANGTLQFGTTTLIDEIGNFAPEETTEYWPRFRPSRWLWFDPAGRARPLRTASHSWNSVHLLRRELIDVIAFHATTRVTRRGRVLFALTSLVGGMVAALCLAPFVGSLAQIVLDPLWLAILNGGVALFLAVTYRREIRTLVLRGRYGDFENFVWPIYMYRSDSSERRPTRRTRVSADGIRHS